jgi:hypothetical protein
MSCLGMLHQVLQHYVLSLLLGPPFGADRTFVPIN